MSLIHSTGWSDRQTWYKLV